MSIYHLQDHHFQSPDFYFQKLIRNAATTATVFMVAAMEEEASMWLIVVFYLAY